MINGLGEAAIQVYYLLSNEVRSPPRDYRRNLSVPWNLTENSLYPPFGELVFLPGWRHANFLSREFTVRE